MTDDRAEMKVARDAGLVKRHEQRLARSDLSIIRAAIDMLPVTCRYHGDNLEREKAWLSDNACCDTGKPALARRYAEEALRRLARD